MATMIDEISESSISSDQSGDQLVIHLTDADTDVRGRKAIFTYGGAEYRALFNGNVSDQSGRTVYVDYFLDSRATNGNWTLAIDGGVASIAGLYIEVKNQQLTAPTDPPHFNYQKVPTRVGYYLTFDQPNLLNYAAEFFHSVSAAGKIGDRNVTNIGDGTVSLHVSGTSRILVDCTLAIDNMTPAGYLLITIISQDGRRALYNNTAGLIRIDTPAPASSELKGRLDEVQIQTAPRPPDAGPE
jgi:hypothetical protein